MKLLLIEGYNEQVDPFLTSEDLQKQLEEKFPDFNSTTKSNGVCKEVSEYIHSLNPKYKVFTGFVSFADGNFIQANSHYVILYNDIIYDFTSNQYTPYGLKPSKGVRILKKVDTNTWVDDEYLITL